MFGRRTWGRVSPWKIPPVARMVRKKKAEVKHLWASDFQPGLVANEKDAEEEERQGERKGRVGEGWEC